MDGSIRYLKRSTQELFHRRVQEVAENVGSRADTERTVEKILGTALNLRDQSANLLIVSNDLFCDGVHYDAGTEAYLRALGALHVLLAGEADAAVECVSGLARMAKGQMPWTDAPIERARRA